MLSKEDRSLAELLLPMINENRQELLQKVLKDRTRYLTVVLEDIFQPQNASAVLRTSDCFGIQDVHVIENRNEFELNPDVELGAARWLNIYRYKNQDSNTESAINKLKEEGYRIVATSPHHNDVSLEEFDLHKGKAAFMFGTELKGLSPIAMEMADEYVKIPMFGFVESFNISVSAAIVLHHLRHQLNHSDIAWGLSEDDKESIWLQWVKNSINQYERIEEALKKKQNIF